MIDSKIIFNMVRRTISVHVSSRKIVSNISKKNTIKLNIVKRG